MLVLRRFFVLQTWCSELLDYKYRVHRWVQGTVKDEPADVVSGF